MDIDIYSVYKWLILKVLFASFCRLGIGEEHFFVWLVFFFSTRDLQSAITCIGNLLKFAISASFIFIMGLKVIIPKNLAQC